DKLDAASHYLRAAILLEQGDAAQASKSLKQAIYLDPDFVLAHFALGNLARSNGSKTEAGKHYANALRLLRNYQAHDRVPESDGLAAGGLNEYITSLITMENLE
ncbi:MAG TPA: tetratricopeptide repeat protein, partial [Methylophilaceae bacterium]|nr:tetratricopeptide repeat protein [Methylophilaceae bacterium]